ncbi:antibiotic biosynthesis monooxygenase [Blastococcus capsensis]|uniref:antibiotic biosynthesis monooxygenase n=1 Tax=Blastococcus capsensis TaxID=1564163 RepID=UPI00254010C9|nr:antibiotic biosynthesis monooxygenase [Blastococcus capsensis]MDK3258675.1 antibiotic biosynthesis monooxygenase [Blastococcus capsensis]
MFAVTRLRVDAAEATVVAEQVEALLAALAARPGFRDGDVGRSADDPTLWALVTRWDGVGAYRRGLSAAEVKIAGAPVWMHAIDEPGAYLPADEPGVPRAEA